MKARKSTGSALLVVIIVTSIMMLYMASVFWVDAYMRRGVQEQIAQEKNALLADGLAEYALAYYLEKKDRLEIPEEVVVNPWPPDGNTTACHGVISLQPNDQGAFITAQLYKKNMLVQSISFGVKEQDDLFVIFDWQRRV